MVYIWPNLTNCLLYWTIMGSSSLQITTIIIRSPIFILSSSYHGYHVCQCYDGPALMVLGLDHVVLGVASDCASCLSPFPGHITSYHPILMFFKCFLLVYSMTNWANEMVLFLKQVLLITLCQNHLSRRQPAYILIAC